jgi:hypothetical protein
LGAVVNSFSFLYAEHAKEGALVQLWMPQGNVLSTKVRHILLQTSLHTCCRYPPASQCMMQLRSDMYAVYFMIQIRLDAATFSNKGHYQQQQQQQHCQQQLLTPLHGDPSCICCATCMAARCNIAKQTGI